MPTMTMQAAVVTDFTRPLELQTLPIPEPGPGQVLVRLEACGVCHTDIHAARGEWPVKPNPPFIPGHEGVGVIETLGEGVRTRRVGERVALPWLGSACGHCGYCVSGQEALCEQQANTGYSIDGGYAQYAVADGRYVVPVPDLVTSLDAAPLTCAGVTTYKAVKVAGAGLGTKIGVFGVGGLGHLAVQYARLAGGFVTAVDIEADKLELAHQLGADHMVNAAKTDPVEEIQRRGGLDVALALAASNESFRQAFASLRRGGRMVCVGLPAEGDLNLPIFETVLGGLSVIGSIVGTRQDLVEVFDLHAAGRTRVIAEGRELADINAVFDEILTGRVPARVVIEY